MGLARDTDVHKRRLSRNLGVGVMLIVVVGLIYGLTFVKVSVLDPARNGAAAQEQAQ